MPSSKLKKSTPKVSDKSEKISKTEELPKVDSPIESENPSETDPALKELFVDSIKDIFWAENHLVKALPKMQKAATSAVLANAIGEHLTVTKNHVTRLEKVFELLGEKVQAKKM